MEEKRKILEMTIRFVNVVNNNFFILSDWNSAHQTCKSPFSAASVIVRERAGPATQFVNLMTSNLFLSELWISLAEPLDLFRLS